jgi:cell division protein FtsB
MKLKEDLYNYISHSELEDETINALLDQLDNIHTYEEFYTFRNDVRWKNVKRKREQRKQMKQLRRSNHVTKHIIEQLQEDKPNIYIKYKYHRQDHFSFK